MRKHAGKIIMALTVIAVIAMGSNGFAQRSMGAKGLHSGYSNLTYEQVKQIDTQRKAFFDATADLKREIYQKRLELKSELAKKDPDAKKAAEIQTQLSTLESHFDQKRLEHMLKMKKINPNAGIGCGYMGGGRGHGGMMGGGPRCGR